MSNREALEQAQNAYKFTFTDAIEQELISAILCSNTPNKFSMAQVKDMAYRISNDDSLNQVLDELLGELI